MKTIVEKKYQKPVIKVIKLHHKQVLCTGSTPTGDEGLNSRSINFSEDED